MVSLTTRTAALEKSYDPAKYGRVSDNPHVEFTVPSLRWPRLAPQGKHVLVARAQYAPYRLANDATWDDAGSSVFADCVTSVIGRVIPRLAEHTVDRLVLSPKDLETRFGLTEGAVTHGEVTLDQIMFMRPVAGWGRYATPVEGLFLGGAGSHPGPGILGAAGWLAAKRALAR
jgi:phytoene dehydrogenase-like protein